MTRMSLHFFPIMTLSLLLNSSSWGITKYCILKDIASQALEGSHSQVWRQIGAQLNRLGTQGAHQRSEAETLRAIMTRRHHHALMLGQGGEGKTTLAQAVLDGFANPPNYTAFYEVPWSGNLRGNILGLMSRTFDEPEQLAQLSEIFGQLPEGQEPNIELINQLMNTFVPNNGELYVFVDEFFERGASVEFISLLSRHPRVHLVVSVTSQEIDSPETQAILRRLVPILRTLGFSPVRTSRLALDEFRTGLNAVARRFNLEITEDAILELYRLSNGVIGRLQRILSSDAFQTRTMTIEHVREFQRAQERSRWVTPTSSGDQFIDDLFSNSFP